MDRLIRQRHESYEVENGSIQVDKVDEIIEQQPWSEPSSIDHKMQDFFYEIDGEEIDDKLLEALSPKPGKRKPSKH